MQIAGDGGNDVRDGGTTSEVVTMTMNCDALRGSKLPAPLKLRAPTERSCEPLPKLRAPTEAANP